MLSQTLTPGNGWTELAWHPGGTTDSRRQSTRTAQNPATEASPVKKAALDDEAWVARIQNGDETAASALVDRLYPTILKIVRCHRPRRTSEEDLLQSVFAKIFSKLHQYSGAAPLEHWVSRIVVNTCINQREHETRRPELRMADLTEQEEAVVQQLVFAVEEVPGDHSHAARELLDQLLLGLKPAERMIIKLLHLDELSALEVSSLTGWSVALVKVRAFRARLKLRKLWKKFVVQEFHRFGSEFV